MPQSINRNAPCPCGSGKKYKRCHGLATAPAPGAARPDIARANALKALDVSVGDRLLRFARRRYGPDWLLEALDAYALLDEDEPSADDLSIVVPWILHYVPPATGGETLAQEWRTHQQRRLSTDEQLLLDAYQDAWLSTWEVSDIERGIGSRLTDLLTREERFVLDASSSAMLERFDTVLGIVLTCDGVSFFGGVHGRPLPPRCVDDIVRATRRACRVRTRPVAPAKLRMPDTQLDLLALWTTTVDLLRHQPPPQVTNTDGDPFLLTRDDFMLLVPREVAAERLASLDEIGEPEEETGDLSFAVTKPGNAMHRSWDNTVVGRIILSAARLAIETNSTRRADTLRARIAAGLEGMVAFRLRTEQNTEQLMADARASGRTKTPGEALDPDAAAALRGFRHDHMVDWLDDSIPALGGLTPREAARSRQARPKLEVLLKEYERDEARLPEEERIGLDWIRQALGLVVPAPGVPDDHRPVSETSAPS